MSLETQFEDLVTGVGRGVEAAGVAAIVIGGIAATYVYARRLGRGGDGAVTYRLYRESLGKAILLGLELLVAADIIRTVATDPTLYNVGVLAGIVLIRTFLSFSLQLEIEGRWPWQRGPAAVPEEAGAAPSAET
jgi:uncharacterized membrane protein